MPELRWILIGCGFVLLIAVYVWGRRSSRSEAGEAAGGRIRPEPQFSEPLAERFEIDDAAASLDDEPELPAATRPEDFSSTAIRSAFRGDDAQYSPDPYAAGDYPDPAEPHRAPIRDVRRSRIEPTLSPVSRDLAGREAEDSYDARAHEDTAELSVDDTIEHRVSHDAPTLGMSNTPQPKRIERRKIVALRLAAGVQRFTGGQLRQMLEAETLQYGKYDVFHRLHSDDGIVFSIASMVEPGTFDLQKMALTTYPGVTLFAQLPGPVPGVEAVNELVACGKRLQDSLGGTLQDERGVPLTVHRIERLRQEVRDFESGPGRELHRSASSFAAPPP